MKILNFGSCNIDYVYSLDHIVENGETETSGKLEIFPGGKGLNQSIALAKAGARVYHAGCIGSDGAMLEKMLKESGADISLVKKVNEKNGHAIIQLSASGENSIFIYPGSNGMVTTEYIDSVLKNFKNGDIVLLQNEISNVWYIVEKAYQKGMCIILNPSPINEAIKKIDFGKLSYIILNEVEAKAISGYDDPEESLLYIRSKYPKLKVMLTLGKRGCVYSGENELVRQNAFKVKAVDTTAAGDTFTGYFVAGISEKKDFKTILRLSSAASAVAVSRMGAAPSIPDLDDVMSVVDNLEENTPLEKDVKSKILKYIDENIKTATLSELANRLGYSAVYTGNLVKKTTGNTFSELLKSRRCKICADKLLTTDEPIGMIIADLGYENESFFRKAFKEKYGKNPLEYRRGEK